MSHSLTKIWIHAVFSVNERANLINSDFENKLYNHIKEKLEKDQNCKVRIINGVSDHVHILYLLSQNFAIKDIMQNIKGESSHWINQMNFINKKFSWQNGYAAFSVSESMVNEVENYIKTQKEHHKKMSFKEEYGLMLKKYGIVE
jgi:putative transposase